LKKDHRNEVMPQYPIVFTWKTPQWQIQIPMLTMTDHVKKDHTTDVMPQYLMNVT